MQCTNADLAIIYSPAIYRAGFKVLRIVTLPPFGWYQIILLGDSLTETYKRVKILPRLFTWKWDSRELNVWFPDCESNALNNEVVTTDNNINKLFLCITCTKFPLETLKWCARQCKNELVLNANVNHEFIQRRVMKHLYCAVCTQW